MLGVVLFAAASPAPALSGEAAAIQSDGRTPEYLDGNDPIRIDLEESLDYADSQAKRWRFNGDFRAGYFASQVDGRGREQHRSG